MENITLGSSINKRCGWCDNDAVSEIEVRPGTFKGVGKNRVPVKLPLTVPVCWDHVDILKSQPRFYTCGCSYVNDHDRCPVHDNRLRKFSRFKDDD